MGLDVVSRDSPLNVEIVDTGIYVAREAAVAYGLRLDGRRAELSGRLANVGVYSPTNNPSSGDGAQTVIGIGIKNTRDLHLETVSVFVSSPDATTVMGILDGESAALIAGHCGGEVFCNGSTGLDVRGTYADAVSTTDGGRAVGMGLLGTAQSFVGNGEGDPSGFNINAVAQETAIGLLTLGTDQLTVDGGDWGPALVSASSGVAAPGVTKLVSAWVDGWDGRAINPDAPLTYGSSGLVMANAALSAFVQSDDAAALSGAILIGTDGAVLDRLILDPVTDSLNSGVAKQVSSLWTVATRDVQIVDCSSGNAPRYETMASELAVAIVDGIYRPGLAPVLGLGSRGLSIEGGRWDRALGIDLAAAPGGVAACMLLVGTYGGSWIGGGNPALANSIDCGISASSRVTELTQVWTLGVQEVVLFGNRIGPVAQPLGGNVRYTTRSIGLRDGDALAEEQFAQNLGATGLQVGSNWITGPSDAPADEFIGIRIERTANGGNGPLWLKNNAIRGVAEALDVGIWTVHAPVEIANNTVHTAWCDPTFGNCPSPSRAVPLYVAAATHDVEVANNILASGPAGHVTLVYDRAGSMATGALWLSLAAFASNILMLPADATTATHLCVGGNAAGLDTTGASCFGDSGTGGGVGAIDDALAELSDNGGLFTSSVDSVVFCDDGAHLKEALPAANAADPAFHPDIDFDGDLRPQTHDIGADEVGDQPVCP